MNNIVSKGLRAAVKPHQQNPSVLNRRCWLTQVGMYNGRKTVVVVVVHEQHEPRVETMMTVSVIMKFNKEELGDGFLFVRLTQLIRCRRLFSLQQPVSVHLAFALYKNTTV